MGKVMRVVSVGSYYFPNGEKYEGDWQGGVMTGQGVLINNV